MLMPCSQNRDTMVHDGLANDWPILTFARFTAVSFLPSELAGSSQPELLAQHSAQDIFEWFLALGDVPAECIVD